MSLFPIFLKLAGRSCLVVGAGTVGESKIKGLIEVGAAVRVVAPRATPAVERWAMAEEISWLRRTFEPADLNGVFLVVVATSSRELNDHIFREAEQRGILCNAVDDPPHCDFYYPSIVRRGDLQLAISTAGHSPALAQRLRRELEQQFAPEYADWVLRLGRVRRGLIRRDMDPERRRRLLHRLASRERFEIFLQRARAMEGKESAKHRS
jgi:precorrin-2 dehydrogenase/sirohydrochlorin ferrochelatase